MSRLFLPNYDDLATFGRDRGTGTVWPSTDLRRGDTFYLTTVAQLGVYTGVGWRLIERGTVATTAIRDGLTWAYAGLRIHVTAVPAEYEFDGAAWKPLALPAVGLSFLNGWVDYDAAAFQPAKVWTSGRSGFLIGLVKVPAGGIAVGGSSTVGTVPVGYRPVASAKPLPTVQIFNGNTIIRTDVYADGSVICNNVTGGQAVPAGQFVTLNLFWNLD